MKKSKDQDVKSAKKKSNIKIKMLHVEIESQEVNAMQN